MGAKGRLPGGAVPPEKKIAQPKRRTSGRNVGLRPEGAGPAFEGHKGTKPKSE